MFPTAIFILVIDLTKELSDLLKIVAYKEAEVESPNSDSEDSSLDHMLRLLDLVHSYASVESIASSPDTPWNKKASQHRSVIMVGAKADLVEGDPMRKMQSLRLTIARHFPECFLKHITEESFVVDNTHAGDTSDQEDRQIVTLRKRIIDLAYKRRPTKQQIPEEWHKVEQEIVSHNVPYVSKTKFRHEIAEKWCPLKEEDDLKELLNFLQSRGKILYADPPNDPDGLVVLDPKWLFGTIREIITAEPKWAYPLEYQRQYDNLKNSGVLSGELLDLACGKLNIRHIKDCLVFIMNKVSLLIEWKIVDGDSIYLVPCMLKKCRDIDQSTSSGPAPLYLRLKKGDGERNIQSDLFLRLVVHFGVWVSTQCTADQPDLYSNAALFFVDEKHTVHIVCHSTAIKLYFTIEDASDQVDTNSFCKTILRWVLCQCM